MLSLPPAPSTETASVIEDRVIVSTPVPPVIVKPADAASTLVPNVAVFTPLDRVIASMVVTLAKSASSTSVTAAVNRTVSESAPPCTFASSANFAPLAYLNVSLPASP